MGRVVLSCCYDWNWMLGRWLGLVMWKGVGLQLRFALGVGLEMGLMKGLGQVVVSGMRREEEGQER
jgi:hypothetical protein